MKYTVKYTSRFRKDYKLMEKRNLEISLLDEIIEKLARGTLLPASNRDHELTGNYAGHPVEPLICLSLSVSGPSANNHEQ